MLQPASSRVDSWLEKAWPGVARYADVRLCRPQLVAVCSSVAQVVKRRPTDAEAAALYSSLEHLLDHAVSGKVLKRNILRVLANWNFIHDGCCVPLWDGSKTTSEVLFLGVARMPARPGALPDLLVKAKLKTGLGAGIIKCGLLSTQRIAQFLEHSSGTGKFKCDLEEIAGMRATSEVSLESDGLFRFQGFSCSEAQKAANRKLTERRSDPFRCEAGLPCSICTKTITECPLAVWLPAPKSKEEHEQ